MLSRFLGNKTELLGPILDVVGQSCPPGGRVGDLFAGTLSVSLALKRAGYSVVANDVMAFSGAIGRAFLLNEGIPESDPDLVPVGRRPERQRRARAWAESLRGTEGFAFLEDAEARGRYEALLTLLADLEATDPADLPEDARNHHFFDTYTEAGSRSAFRSSRGSEGRRRFFSPENGQRIDAVADRIRVWFREGRLEGALYPLLCCVLFRAVEKVSNTQGTYHDFPREFYDPRALKPLRLVAPPMDTVLVGGAHHLGSGDSLEYARRAPPMDVLYLDPPYNFRQYTAYYFMPNLLCRYAEIDDLEAWFEGVSYVRGQNMADDFSSTFCSKGRFLEDLGALIDRTPTRSVVLSYFNGRNHWNDFKKDPNGIGREFLEAFFSSPRFEAGSLEVRPVDRTNYQSYGGYRARRVAEYLFHARKTQETTGCVGETSSLEKASETGCST